MDLFLSSAVREIILQLLQLEEREEKEFGGGPDQKAQQDKNPHNLQQWKCEVITRPESICGRFCSTFPDSGVALHSGSQLTGVLSQQ